MHNVRTDDSGKDDENDKNKKASESSRSAGCVESLWGSHTDLTSCLVSTVLCVCKLFNKSSSQVEVWRFYL